MRRMKQLKSISISFILGMGLLSIGFMAVSAKESLNSQKAINNQINQKKVVNQKLANQIKPSVVEKPVIKKPVNKKPANKKPVMPKKVRKKDQKKLNSRRRRLAQHDFEEDINLAEMSPDDLVVYEVRRKIQEENNNKFKFHLKHVKSNLNDISNICGKTNWNAKTKLDFFEKKLALIYEHAHSVVGIGYVDQSIENLSSGYNLGTVSSNVKALIERKKSIEKNTQPAKKADRLSGILLQYYRYYNNVPETETVETILASNYNRWLRDFIKGLSCIK